MGEVRVFANRFLFPNGGGSTAPIVVTTAAATPTAGEIVEAVLERIRLVMIGASDAASTQPLFHGPEKAPPLEHLQQYDLHTADLFELRPSMDDSGTPDAEAPPIPHDLTLQEVGLAAPFTVCFAPVHFKLPVDASDAVAHATSSTSDGHAARQAILEVDREEQERIRQEIDARREENIRRIEQQRRSKEVDHFSKCESYEVLRREKAKAVALERERAEQAAKARAEEDSLRTQVHQEQAMSENERLVMEHKAEMEARRIAVEERRAQIERQRQAEEAAAEQARRDRTNKKKLEREATRSDRINNDLKKLLTQLENNVSEETSIVEEHMQAERDARARAERERLELQSVANLEHHRSAVKAPSRAARRSQAELNNETLRLQELSRIEAQEQAAEKERARYEEWAQKLRKDAELVQLSTEHQLLSHAATSPL